MTLQQPKNDERHDVLEKRIDRMERQIDCIKHDTSDLVDAFRSVKGGLRVLMWLGKLAAPVAAIGAAWASFKAGFWR